MQQHKSIVILIGMLSFYICAHAQNVAADCGENPDSPQKLFVFIGERLSIKSVDARELYNETRFIATYKIIKKICGNYPVDTITFDVIDIQYDTSFARCKYLLLTLIKDTAQGGKLVLWGGLYRDVFKTRDGTWAATYDASDNTTYRGKPVLNPHKMRFSKNAFYNITGLTREEINIRFPEPYYKIKKNKVLPVLGNSIEEIFQFQKYGTLAESNIYTRPDTGQFYGDSGIVVKDVEILPLNEDSLRHAGDSIYQTLKATLEKDPFNEKNITALLQNCRRQDNYDNCSLFFENLLHKFPDSVRAYLLTARYRYHRVSLDDSSGFDILRQALRVDNNNYEANYILAKSFYALFYAQPGPYHAYWARKYLMRSADIDSTQRMFLQYPISQLSYYLNDTSVMHQYTGYTYRTKIDQNGLPTGNMHNWYFPFGVFLDPGLVHTADYRVNIMDKVRHAINQHDLFSEELAFFKEPVLNQKNNEKVFRFLWLRSFHVPILIRLENSNHACMLKVKVARYNDSVQQFISFKETTKKIGVRQWNTFKRLLSGIDFWSMVSQDYHEQAADGAIWLLEASDKGRYKVVERQGHVYPQYTNCLKYLLGLTDLHLPENDIY